MNEWMDGGFCGGGGGGRTRLYYCANFKKKKKKKRAILTDEMQKKNWRLLQNSFIRETKTKTPQARKKPLQ